MSNQKEIAKEDYKESMETSYCVSKRFGSITFQEAIDQVKAALESEGFDVIMQFDMHEHVKKSLKKEISRYTVLGACHAPLAMEVLSAENKAGIMLPCNVLVQDLDLEGMIEISVVDPSITFSLAGNDELKQVGAKAKSGIHQILNNIENQNMKL